MPSVFRIGSAIRLLTACSLIYVRTVDVHAQGSPPAVTASAPPSAADTVTGRVVSGSNRAPIVGALVFVTRGPDRLVLQDTTDDQGRWQLVFAPGTGDYLVFVSAAGAQSFRKRVMRVAAEQRFVVDATLSLIGAAQLAAVRVRADAPRPDREDRTGPRPTVGSNERSVEGVYGAIAPGSAGDPLAAAATIPGLNVGAGGVSALGAGGDQSLTTLNGLASGARLPREAATRTRGSLSNYDPSVGGFSGALVAQELEPGREDTRRSASFTIDAPAFRSDDALARAFGLRPASLQGSFGRSGQLVDDRVFYTSALQLARSSATQASLFSAPASVLKTDGLQGSALQRIQQGLASARIPLGASTPSDVIESLNFVGQLDRTPRGPHALRVTGLLDARRVSGIGVGPLTLPDVGRRDQDIRGAVQVGSVLLTKGKQPFLNDFRASVSGLFSTRKAGSTLPAAIVRVPDPNTDVASLADAVPTLSIAGYGGTSGDSRTLSWEAADDLSWLRGGRKHLFKVHAWTRVDAAEDETIANARGTYSYNSLADLTANRPAAYSRTLAQPTRSGVAWNSAAAFAHRWAPARVFQLLWGARVESNRFIGSPDANRDLETALGVRTDRLPSSVGISPRLGMTWYLVRDRAGGVSTTATDLSSRSTLPVGMIRAGVGEFRGLYRPGALADADGATGLPNALRRLSCVGTAVGTPDWSTLGSADAPISCAAGSPALSDASAPVSVFARNYQPPRNWRASAGWTSRAFGVDYRADATYALNFDQPSIVDRNFSGVQTTTLPFEGGRPAYFRTSDVDPRTGGVSAVGSRIAGAFGSVTERRSDLRGRAGQVTISLTPDLSLIKRGGDYLNVNYTFASARAQARGFDAGTGTDPRAIEWARSPFDSRHQILAQLSKYLPRGVGLSMFLRLESGRPFTPLVGGDINGDGRANDRAYIPSVASFANVTAFDALLASVPPAIRKCLNAQRGSVAGINSCEGPWTQAMEVRLDIPGRVVKLPDRARLALQFVNPLGALDRALHGADNLRGWGTASAPDNVLLIPRAFTRPGNDFSYDVNPRFGDTRPSRTSRPLDPFGVTLDVRVNFSERGEVQSLRRQLKPGRGGDRRPRLSTDTLMARYQRGMPSLFVAVQAMSDTLLLTPQQMDSLTSAEMRYREQLAEVYKPLVEYLAKLPDAYNAKEALDRAQHADSLAWDITFNTGAQAKSVLSSIQMTILPRFMRDLINEDPAALRRDHARYSITVSPQGSSFSMNRN